MLDYKGIITKRYALGMSGREIARTLSVSKTGVNNFLNAFKECETLKYPLPEGITNYGIAAAVYGSDTTASGRDLSYELPDYEAVYMCMCNSSDFLCAAPIYYVMSNDVRKYLVELSIERKIAVNF